MPDLPKSDPELRDLLQSWQIDARDDPALARGVWARLEREEPRGVRSWFENAAAFLARPTAAVAAIVLFAALGAMAAELSHAQKHDARISQLAAAYAHSIDPILMTHSGHVPESRP